MRSQEFTLPLICISGSSPALHVNYARIEIPSSLVAKRVYFHSCLRVVGDESGEVVPRAFSVIDIKYRTWKCFDCIDNNTPAI